MGRKLLDISNRRFGRLTAVSLIGRRNGQTLWRCVCQCGRVVVTRSCRLTSGETKSCGCFAREQTSLRGRKQIQTSGAVLQHGRLIHGKWGSAEYRTWKGIVQRCTNPINPAYVWYGGRGIRVCKKWRSFAGFYADMGDRPSPKHSIDRINVNGHYAPSNCRWATASVQSHNRRNTITVRYRGKKMKLSDAMALAKCGVTRQTVIARISDGFTVRDALESPARFSKT